MAGFEELWLNDKIVCIQYTLTAPIGNSVLLQPNPLRLYFTGWVAVGSGFAFINPRVPASATSRGINLPTTITQPLMFGFPPQMGAQDGWWVNASAAIGIGIIETLLTKPVAELYVDFQRWTKSMEESDGSAPDTRTVDESGPDFAGDE